MSEGKHPDTAYGIPTPHDRQCRADWLNHWRPRRAKLRAEMAQHFRKQGLAAEECGFIKQLDHNIACGDREHGITADD